MIENSKYRSCPALSGVLPGLIAGVLLLAWLPELPAWWFLIGLLAAAAVVNRRFACARWLPGLALGISWAWLHAFLALQSVLPASLEGRDLTLVGEVTGLPESYGEGMRFMFDAEAVEVGYAAKVRLNWYRNAPQIRAGERWRLRVRLKTPHGFSNPGGFDYEGWLFRQGIRATGYVRSDPINQRLPPEGWGLTPVRQDLRDRLTAFDLPPVGAAFLPALILGDRAGVERDQWEVLTRTGTNHLIAISGLHVGIVAGLVFFLSRSLWRRVPGLAQRLAAERAAVLFAWPAALGYSALAGFAISTQRALIMLTVVFGALLLRRTLRPWSGLLAAWTAVLLFDPMAPLSPGFWLSFAAVAALLFGLNKRVGEGGLLVRWGKAQWVVALGLLPVLFLLFGKASLIAPLANLVAVPLFSLLLLPLVLAATVASLFSGMSEPLWAVSWLLEQCFLGLQWLSAFPWAAWTLPDKPAWAWFAAFLGVVLLLSPRGVPGRWTGSILLLPLLIISPERPPPGAFRFTLLDVGQGLAVVVQTHDHLLVFDTGPMFSSGFNTGSAVVAPFLRSRGLERIDRLVVSHADKDHAGGVAGLLRELPASDILSGEPSDIAAADVGLCRAGMHWLWDGVSFSIFHPTESVGGEGNNRSCVLRIENRSGSVLLTGDVEKVVETDLVAAYGETLKSHVLVAGHHGSNTSTSKTFLDAVRPDYVLYAAGYNNRYGFPSAEVRKRVQRTGAKALQTAVSGAIEIDFPAVGRFGEPRQNRPSVKRYWNRSP